MKGLLSVRLFLAVVTLLPILGCGMITKDPLATFKDVVAKVDRQLSTLTKNNKEITIDKPVAFDVRKSDSLTSPYVASIKLSAWGVSKTEEGEQKGLCNWNASYAFQNDTWVCKKISMTIVDMTWISGDMNFFNVLKEISIKRGPITIKDAALAQTADKIAVLLRDCTATSERESRGSGMGSATPPRRSTN